MLLLHSKKFVSILEYDEVNEDRNHKGKGVWSLASWTSSSARQCAHAGL